MFPFPSLTRCNADVGPSSKCWVLLVGVCGVLGQASGSSYERNLTLRSLPPQEQCSAPESQRFPIWSKTLYTFTSSYHERAERACLVSCKS
jgi:hypothetical protein